MPSDAEPVAEAKRLSPATLFIEFTRITLTAFGGVIVVARRAMVDQRRWLTDAEFAEMLAVGQILPGPNVINLAAAFGDRHAGWAGAAAAVSGLVVAPAVIALSIAALLLGAFRHPLVEAALAGMAAAAAGLVVATALRMARGALRGAIAIVLCLAIFAAVVLARLPLALVILAALPLSLWLHGAFRRAA